MNLILLVKRYRDQPLPDDVTCRFTEAGGSIGRGPDNDLTLDDPGKYISRVHARIEWRGEQFYLTDTGSNPSLVNERPLGNGRERALEEGDRLVMGDYVLEVQLELPVLADPQDDAMATRILPPLFVPPPAALVAPLPPLEMPLPAYREPEPVVLHDALAGARILEGGSLFEGLMPLADPLGLNLMGRVEPAFRGTESDHVAPQMQAFSLPLPQVIPDDYDPLVGMSPTQQQSLAHPDPNVGAGLPAMVVNDNEGFEEERGAFEPFASKPAPTLKQTASASDDAVLHALLQGLGLPDLHTTRTPVELAQLVGEMLRAATGGTMDVLMARALTKRESHIDMTMIGAHSNNPLKFFPDPHSALSQMLSADSQGYMRPVKAMSAAFDDLKAHELAVIAGMKAALGAVVQRFDPARVEQRRTTHGAFDKWMPARRKARLWDRLVERYEDLVRDADEDLQRLFGELFSVAYEEQIARLRPPAPTI